MSTDKDVFSKEDKKFMNIAFRLAEKGRGTTNPNPMVGALIVKDDMIISSGYHKMSGTDHAEINAIKNAKNIPEGSKIYVTLEPCSFYGKTPPCTEAIIKHKFSEVIISSLDPNPKVNGKGAEILKKAGIKVRTGLMCEKAEKQNEIFFKQIRLKRPFVCAKIASTIDGKLAASTGNSRWITGITSRNTVQKLRFEYGCVLTGIGTVIKDNPFLCPRKNIAKTFDLKNLNAFEENMIRKYIVVEDSESHIKKKLSYSKFLRVVLDGNLIINQDSNIARTSKLVKTIIFVLRKAQRNKSNADKIKQLKLMGIDIIAVGKNEKNGYLNLNEIIDCLYNKYEATSIMVEAGPSLVTSFLKEKLIDKFVLFLAPKIIGGKNDYNMFADLNIKYMKDALNLKFDKIKNSGKDLLIEAYPLY
ncbi:MAG: bifunctional diaminohydroxyphosphoribosylaminopyrimidine deaminase/5-amino-6-(5-phosphoribosylamino)uracil reductase RibD [Actinomycetota bacterium]|nr:bifunctional diaminohydroxyphosphoribosylaminopyrimidine deaminase/5-amino-6-(5-phosphoribosylamino)uracil reductase RibD [Actinomycetota bacterium]